MKTIIRIEHPKSGNGIWQHIESGDNLCDSFSFYEQLSNKHNDFPSPRRDLGINRSIEDDEYCAFKSIEQIHQWIEKEWFTEIISFGFKIYMIDVSECIEGEYQILFKIEHILQQKDISSLFITNSIAIYILGMIVAYRYYKYVLTKGMNYTIDRGLANFGIFFSILFSWLFVCSMALIHFVVKIIDLK